ncbi:MAG: ImmA/IrrE family metallo-endopeptidase [Theionarchaea archaeon]|nr:ImmA/IrrE family metallo-endopeptidase [Theionarchaea archaeon]
MPGKFFRVEVNPAVFKWLRESSGWTHEDVGKRLKTNVETIKEIEVGTKKPTLQQLKELSQAYNRPIAAFLLPEPEIEKPLPKDYRMLPNKEGIFDRKTILALRKARSLQEISKELSSNIEYDIIPKIKKINLSDNPDIIAEQYRKIFGLTGEKQKKFPDAYKLFNYLRDILEDMNILVFQFSMPIEDVRGVALADDFPATIVVNKKDTITARLFSLMHEFAHILLGETAIDIPELSIIKRNKIEFWCNEFGSSFLLPKKLAKMLFESEKNNLTGTETLKSLSGKYKVSKRMLLYNMYKLNYIPISEYKDVLERYSPEKPSEKSKKKKQKGGISQERKCLSEVGNKFVSLVANNFDENYITYSDALNFLSIKSENFDKVMIKASK